MPSNKKHHYVPRFYLKRFSPDGRSICIWNIRKELKVRSVNLKNQCYKDYFYGKDVQVEKALSTIESHAAGIFRLIDRYEAPPPCKSEDYVTLVIYMLMQYGRTAYSADSLNEMHDKLIKHLLGPKAKAEGIDLEGIMVGIKNSAQFSVGATARFYPLMLDMNCKLLINETNTEFVVSDNPVVMYNQLLSFRSFGSNTGFAAKGLQVFFPIRSRMMIVLYDYESYRVGSHSKLTLKLSSPRDVYELNTLQMTSAYENLYYENKNFDVESLMRKARPFRRRHKSDMKIFPGEQNERGRKEFLATLRIDVRTNLKLSFVDVTRSTKKWLHNFKQQQLQPAVIPRNDNLLRTHEEFMKRVDSGEFKPSEFFRYLELKHAGG